MVDILKKLYYERKNIIDRLSSTDKNKEYLEDCLRLLDNNISMIKTKYIKSYIKNIDDINITLFSSLRGVDLIDLLQFIRIYNINYREIINVDTSITFGVEIEYENLFLYTARDFVLDNNIKWHVKHEDNVLNGGEIVSNVMSDNKENWNNLKKICDFLKTNGATTKFGTCGGHIHIGLPIFNCEENYFKFLKCYMLYEDILNRFFCGEYVNIRKNAKEYADLCKNYIIDKNNSYYYIPRTKGLYTTCFSFNIFGDKNTLEFRRPNGTLEEVIWQNNINAIIKMILAINSNNFDIDYIINKLKINKDRIINKYDSAYDHELNLEKALEFVDLFYDNNLDKINFLKQYIKGYELSLKRKELVRTNKFWV